MDPSRDGSRPMILVSRHEGARQWLLQEAEARGWHPVHLVRHLTDADWHGARGVAGTLPLAVISQLCDAGIPVWQIHLPQDEETRGVELSAAEMVARGACLRQVKLVLMGETC